MFAYCDECGYDSGDFDTREEIYQQIETDGGQKDRTEDGNLTLECPNGHDSIRID